jgi:hypothetical protein
VAGIFLGFELPKAIGGEGKIRSGWTLFRTSRSGKRALEPRRLHEIDLTGWGDLAIPDMLLVLTDRFYVLGYAVAERPVFLLHLDKVDENVLASEANAFV